MAIQTETIILKVEGQTDGAVRATEKLADAQKKLSKAAAGAGEALTQATVPASGLFGKISEGLKSASFDTKKFGDGIRDIGKGMTFDLIRNGLKALNTDLNTTAKSALSAGVSGASMGAAFGGPLGAAIGGAAGALVGLIKHTDQQTEASLRAADAAKKHAAALKLIADGETKDRAARRDARQELEAARAEYGKLYDLVQKQDAVPGKRASEGAVASLQRAKRLKEDLEDEREALNKAGGNIWLEEQKRNRQRERALEDLEAARKRAYISNDEYEKRLAALNKTEEKHTEVIKKQTEATYANVQAALAAMGVRQSTDGRQGPSKYSTSLGAKADSTSRDMYGRDAEQGDVDRIEAERRKKQFGEGLGAIGAAAGAEKKRKSLLESSFGKIEEINAYKTAFDGLTGAVTAGMDAWITGSESAGTAVKKFLGHYLAGLAAQMAIEGLKYEAYAVASLVPGPFFNPAAASGYAATGAMFLAGAGAAAVAAKAMGGGVSTPTGGGGAGAGASGGASGGADVNRDHRTGNGQQNTIIVYADPFADMDARQRALYAEKTFKKVSGGSGGTDN